MLRYSNIHVCGSVIRNGNLNQSAVLCGRLCAGYIACNKGAGRDLKASLDQCCPWRKLYIDKTLWFCCCLIFIDIQKIQLSDQKIISWEQQFKLPKLLLTVTVFNSVTVGSGCMVVNGYWIITGSVEDGSSVIGFSFLTGLDDGIVLSLMGNTTWTTSQVEVGRLPGI